MKRKLDLLANVSIALLCLTISGVLIKKHFFPEPPPELPQTVKGELLSLPEALAPRNAELVLVAALAPACGYCDESMAFYRALSERRSARAADLRFIAAVRDEDQVEKERRKLQAAGVDVDGVVVADFKTLGVPGTPMLIVADRRGEVLGAWLGKLAESQEHEVLETLGFGETSSRDAAASAVAVAGGG